MIALALVVIGSVLAIGGVHTSVTLIIAAASLIAPGLAVALGTRPRSVSWLPPPAVVLMGVSAYSLFQALPLPQRLTHALSPSGAEIWGRALLPFGEGSPTMTSLSLDPGASAIEAAKWLAYAATFAAASLVGSRRGAAWGVGVVFVSALLTATTTILHGLLGLHKVFGIYEPQFVAGRWNVGPLLNSNNLAGYLNIGILCGLGLMMASRSRFPPWLVGSGIAVLVGTSVVSASRAGVLSLPVGVWVFWRLITRSGRSDLSHARGAKWSMVSVIVGGLVLAVLGGDLRTWTGLLDSSAQKLDMIAWSKPLIGKFPVFGIGRGACETVFAAYRAGGGHTVFTHIENFVAQWVVEWGLPVGGAALAALTWTLRPSAIGAKRSTLNAAVCAAMVVLTLQNMVDLAFEVPAVCIAVALALGSAYGATPKTADAASTGLDSRDSSDTTADRDLVYGKRRLWAGLAAGYSVIVLVAATALGSPATYAERDEVRLAHDALDARKPAQLAKFKARLRRAVLRHPAEPYFPLMGGLATLEAGGNAIPWAARAIERDPLSSRAHLLLAYALVGRKNLRQALLELRWSVEADPLLARHVARVAVGWTTSYGDLMRTVPNGETGQQLLVPLANALTNPADRAARIELLQRALERSPTSIDARVEIANDLIARVAANSPDCGNCVDVIEHHAKRIGELDPASPAGVEIRGRLLLAQGRGREALTLLADSCTRFEERLTCLELLMRAAAQTNDLTTLRRAANDLAVTACASHQNCADAVSHIGDIMLESGFPQWAGEWYSRSAREDPTSARWLKVADAASRGGFHADAAAALKRCIHLSEGDDPSLRARMRAEQDMAVRAVVGQP